MDLIPVSGRVTLDGQVVPGPGTLYFTVAEPAAGHPRRPGKAEFAADGTFEATSIKQGDGLVPGSYKVAVHCWQTMPTSDNPSPKILIPEHYCRASSSGLTLDVNPDDSEKTWNVELRSR